MKFYYMHDADDYLMNAHLKLTIDKYRVLSFSTRFLTNILQSLD